MTRTIVFSHANGFPSGTYRQVFDVWRRAGWTVLALDKFGHDPRYPVSSNWPRLRQQLVDFVQAQAPEGAYLVGHSLGGLLSLMAACRRPELALGVVMLDSPVITGWRAHSVRLLKASRLIGKVSPARRSKTRRTDWPDRNALISHWQQRAIFARWAPGVLDDYVACGTRSQDGRLVLAFDRAVETRIYNTLPHNLDSLLRRHPLRCPLGFIAGTQSPEVRTGGLAAVRHLAGDRLLWVPGSHLYPMEVPQQTAEAVLRLLEGMRPG